MSGIPGTAGSAPVQNIAAYGQNIEDVFIKLKAVNIKTGKIREFNKKDCGFEYRSSFFKTKGKGKYIVTQITLKLSKNCDINTSYHERYRSVNSELNKTARPPYTLKDVRKAVLSIRKLKFPDTKTHGTAGSYFLNPVISKKKLKVVQKKAPGVQYYPVDKLTYPKLDDPRFDHEKYVKVAAGWLLQELGWMGKRIGNVGTSPNQAMVIINYGGATAEEILDFANKMKKDMQKNFGITLQPEVTII